MAKKLYEEASVLAIANAIRAKNGSTATYKIADMADAVMAIAPLQPAVGEYQQMNATAAAYLTAAYTNQIPISTDAGGAVFNGVGYQQGYRLSSSGNPSPQASTYITGFIPVHSGDTVRFEGMNLKEGSAPINEQRIAFYDANKAVIAAPYWKDTGTNTMSGGYLASLTVPAYSGKTVAFARFGCYWIDSHSIITVNEEIG